MSRKPRGGLGLGFFEFGNFDVFSAPRKGVLPVDAILLASEVPVDRLPGQCESDLVWYGRSSDVAVQIDPVNELVAWASLTFIISPRATVVSNCK